MILGVCCALVALIWFVFSQTIRFPFVNFDDPEYVYEVPEINHGLTWHNVAWAFTHFPSPNWYPLTNISHMIEFQWFGMNAGGYHLTNVLLHAIAAVLLFVVLRRMTAPAVADIGDTGRNHRYQVQQMWPCAFVAAVFAIHPLRVESVAWVVERKDVLSGVFFMLTLAAYVWYTRQRSIARYVVMSMFLACGLMSKPMLITAPVILLLLDYWPLGRCSHGPVGRRKAERGNEGPPPGRWLQPISESTQGIGDLILEKLPLFALSIVLAFISSAGISRAGTMSGTLPLGSRIGNALVSYVVYIRQMIWPIDLAVWYPQSPLPVWEVVLAAMLLIGVSALAFTLRRSRPYFFIGWFWYLVMMAPVIGVIQVNLQAHGDRYTYLPHIGLYIIVVWTVGDLLKTSNAERRTSNVKLSPPNWALDVGRWTLGVGFFAIILALALTARAQTSYWRDSESLWTRAIAVTKDNAFAHASLADLLMRRGRLDEAILHSEEAIRIQPNNADAHNNLGLALLQKGDESAAAEQFKQSLENDPNQMNAMVNLAWILATSSDSSTRDGVKAVELAEMVNQRAGHVNVIVLRTLAAAYAETGRFPDAIETAEEAERLATVQGNTGLAQDLQRNIDSYRQNRPLRSR